MVLASVRVALVAVNPHARVANLALHLGSGLRRCGVPLATGLLMCTRDFCWSRFEGG